MCSMICDPDYNFLFRTVSNHVDAEPEPEDPSEGDWIGLDLFNDDTHPSGYISRPSHVGFSHICLSSTKRSGGAVKLRISSVSK